jgi:hypothetical protein
MARSMTNGTKSRERADAVVAGRGLRRAIGDYHLLAGGALGLLPPGGPR